MARSNLRLIFFYLLFPAIFIIFLYSFIFATKFSTINPMLGYSTMMMNNNYNQNNNNDGNINISKYDQLQQQQQMMNSSSTIVNNNFNDNNQSKQQNVINSIDKNVDYNFENYKNFVNFGNSTPIIIDMNDLYVNLINNQSINTNNHTFNYNLWNNQMEKRFNQQQQHQQQQQSTASNKFPLKVIIVPHSHNDPGWLNTYDQYFYHYTYYILDNLIKNLFKYKQMTFVWAEMSFFSRWWNRLPNNNNNKMKENLKHLLQEKRLEFVTGGWVMNDEAITHYYDMIDQLIEGHQFLRSELQQSRPLRNSFSIDPFGHSTTYPYLLRISGIENIYIQRTHHVWKQYLSEKRYLDFYLKQSFQNPHYDQLPFCHMSPLHLYSFKYACGPDPNVCLEFDFRKIYGEHSESTAVPLNETNLNMKAMKILKQYSKLGSLFEHNVALVLLGDDFRYNFDIEWQQQYRNYMLLIDYINSNGEKFENAEIRFGTIDDYFQSINERIPIKQTNNYPILNNDDFMPYADSYVDQNVSSYWTGFYTTRPYFKSLSRELQSYLRATEIFYTLTRNFIRQHLRLINLNKLIDQDYQTIANARQNLALFQHHDGITGTSKDYVMSDYGRRLNYSLNQTMILLAKLIQYLNYDNDIYYNLNNLNNTYNDSDMNEQQQQQQQQQQPEQFIHTTSYRANWHTLTEQHVLNIPSDRNDGLHLMLLNSHTKLVHESIKIYVNDPFIKILDIENDKQLSFQINPIYENDDNIKISSKIFEIEFHDQLYPLSLKNYKIITNEDNVDSKVIIYGQQQQQQQQEPQENLDFSDDDQIFKFHSQIPNKYRLENDELIVTINADNGFIEKIYFKQKNLTKHIDMSFISYNSMPRKSGAYLMKFIDRHRNLFIDQQKPIISHYRGKLSSKIIVNYTDIVYSIKLYNMRQSALTSAIEFNLLINLEDKTAYDNKEVALRLGTNIANNNPDDHSLNYRRKFFVDSNGFQMIERRFIDAIGIEGNYYPMTTSIFIEEDNIDQRSMKNRFTILSSHSHGVTSPEDGMIEIMLDRRIVYDDKRGLNEGILDNLPVQSKFLLLFEFDLSSTTTTAVPILSQKADSLLLNLNYPSIQLYSYENELDITKDIDRKYYRNRYLIAPSTLCKYFLLNLRTLPVDNDFNRPSKSSLMILHNRQTIISNNNDGNLCENQNQNQNIERNNSFTHQYISIKHLFNDVLIESLEKTLLTGMKAFSNDNDTNNSIKSLSQIQIPPFELQSFNITF